VKLFSSEQDLGNELLTMKFFILYDLHDFFLAVTPTLEELKPSVVQYCENKIGNALCRRYINAGFECNGKYIQYFKKNCAKLCGLC